MDQAADERVLTQVGEALQELTKIDPPLVEMVDMKFFRGFAFAESAAMKSISERTAQSPFRCYPRRRFF